MRGCPRGLFKHRGHRGTESTENAVSRPRRRLPTTTGVPMNLDIALILSIDGLANGAVYLLAGLGLVLIFSVTRVVFVPFGDVAAFAALSLAAFETGRTPATIWLVLTLAALAVIVEVGSLIRHKEYR